MDKISRIEICIKLFDDAEKTAIIERTAFVSFSPVDTDLMLSQLDKITAMLRNILIADILNNIPVHIPSGYEQVVSLDGLPMFRRKEETP